MLFGVAALGQVGDNRNAPTSGAGTLKTARIISSLEANDNYNLSEESPGNALLWTNTLEFGIQQKTDVDSFNASASGDLRFADLPVLGQDTSLDNGTVRANYARNIEDNAFAFRLLYNDADLEFLDPLRTLDSNGAVDDTRGSGRRSLLEADFSLSLNETGPFSLEFSGAVRDRDYRDTTDPSLNDRLDLDFGITTGLKVASGYRALLGGTYGSSVESNDKLDNERIEIYTGLLAEPTPTTQYDFRIGYSEFETTRDDRDTISSDGTVARLSVTEQLSNGNVSFLATSRLYETGRRNQMSVGRRLDLPAGAFYGAIGVANNDNFDIRPFVNLSYSMFRPTSQLTFNFNQALDVDDEGNDVLNAGLSADYSYQINQVSSIYLSALAANRLQLDDASTENDISRITLIAQYNHTITRDWQMSTGLRHRSRYEEYDDNALSNAFFVTLTRSFSTK